MTKFHLIRHAEPDWSMVKERRPYIEVLCPLSDNGIRQAIELASDPRLNTAEIIVSSPYTRALQTAAVLSSEMQLPLKVEYDLREWAPSSQLQSSKDSIIRAFKEDLKKCNSSKPEDLAKSGIETMEGVRSRARGVLERYLGYREVIAVSHGVVIESLSGQGNVGYGEIVEISI